MRSIDSTAFQTVEKLENHLGSLSLHNEVYASPYSPKPLKITGLEDQFIYSTEDIAFVNTVDFTRTGQHYAKHGIYTTAHPIFNKREYKEFWDLEETRRKQGLTLPGKLYLDNDEWKIQEVHITGEHYGYLNYGEIKRSKEFDKKKGIILSPHGEKITTETLGRGGTKKERLLPSFWDGDYYFFKAVELCKFINRHLVVGKARRKGYSYKNGFLVANLADLYPFSTSVTGAYDGDSLFEDGTMNKVMGYLDFINKHTDWKKRRLHNRLDHIEIGYRLKNDPVKRGHQSNIYTSILSKDPGGLRGKDADLILVEEAGKMVNLEEVLGPTLKTLEDGIFMTGLMIVFGTGGGDDKYWQAFESLFFETYLQKFISFENDWDDDLRGDPAGFFHGAFMSKPGLIDRHGNSDVFGSIAFENKERKSKESNPVKQNAHIMEEPFKPTEAFSRSANSMMPIKELDLQLKRVRFDPDIKNLGREGIFVNEGGKIQFVDRASLGINSPDIPPVVSDFPHKDTTDVRGCWVIWESPYRDPKTGQIPENLYRVWNDPFGIAKDSTEFNMNDSLAGTYIYEVPNTFTATRGDRIVAEFIGRRESFMEYDREMFNGVLYYNAMLTYENDRGEVFTNANTLGLVDRLTDEPEFVYQKDLQKGGKGRKKGISIASNPNRKITGATSFRNWLLIKRGTHESGAPIYNLHYIYSAGLLQESIKYDGKRNTDRVSTCIVGMFDIKEFQYKNIVPEDPSTSIVHDDYFN